MCQLARAVSRKRIHAMAGFGRILGLFTLRSGDESVMPQDATPGASHCTSRMTHKKLEVPTVGIQSVGAGDAWRRQRMGPGHRGQADFI